MTNGESVLVVDDDAEIVAWLVEELVASGREAVGVTEPQSALARLEERAFDLVISDVEMPTMRGVDLLPAIHARRPDQLVILITAFGSIELAMRCVREGASDFLAKPFTFEGLEHAIERTLRERRMKRELVRLRRTLVSSESGELVAESPAMRRVLDVARRAAQSSSTVLLTGESGVGKSAVARWIHAQGSRAERELVELNCAALPAGLVEAELFGVRRGAYTDAREDRAGLFVRANGGTLFLDEIGEMALEAQPKLLAAIERGEVRPVGGTTTTTVDVRVIAATNRPLEEAVRARTFRDDLFHRLDVVRIEVPPLRERAADIPHLVDRLLDRLSVRTRHRVQGVTDEAMRWLCTQPWPGNVRALANALERATMFADHDALTLADFHGGEAPPDDDAWLEGAAERAMTLDALERRYIARVLERFDGNKSKAARALGIDRTTLWRKLQE
jgi:DNA-binding NtrC family response regulator